MGKLTLFNGGMSTVLAPHLIQENEGGFYINVDHRPGTLKPMRDKVSRITDAKRFGHYFTSESKWYWSDLAMDYVEFQERLYIGNRYGTSTKIVVGEESRLGIVVPTVNPSIAGTSYELADITDVTLFALGDLTINFASILAIGDIPNDLDLEYRFVTENTSGALSAAETVFPVKTGTLGPNAVYISIADKGWNNDVHVYRKHLGDWRLVTTATYDPNLDSQPVIQDIVYDISANTILNESLLSPVGQLNGTLNYAYTFYNSALGIESVPKLITPPVTVINGIVELTNLEVSTDPQVDRKRIYRIGGNLTDYHLVDTINNPITSYIDNIADLDLSGELLQSSTNYHAPDRLNWLIEAYAMLFGAVGDQLRFTPIGKPDYWPQTYFLDFPTKITGIGKTPIGLLVFTEFETFLVTGTGPLALSQQLLSGSQGCIAGDSVVNIQGATYWASTDGICISEGGRIVNATRPKVTKMNLTKTVNAVVYDQEYYILAEDNGIAYILDTERKALRSALYDIRSLVVANDTLYGYTFHRLYQLEVNKNANLSMAYASPEFIGVGLTIQKVYKNVYVKSSGEVDIIVLIDGKAVQQVLLTTDDNHQIKIPAQESRGFKIAFSATGTGTVYEITWSDGNASQ